VTLIRAVILVLVVVPIGAPAAAGQTMDPPPRVTQPPRTGGTTQSLGFDSSLFVGFDPGSVPGAGVLTNPSNRPNTLTGWGSANLRYSIDAGSRAFSVGGGATASSNSSATDGPVYGSSLNASFSTPLWQGLSFSISESVGRAPYYTTGVFGGVPPGWYAPDSNPVNGIFDGHLLSFSSTASLGYSATRHTGLSFNYAYMTSLHEGSSNFSNADHSFGLSVTQQITRSIGTRLSYRTALRQAEQSGLSYDGMSHGFTYGINLSQPIGATRTLAIAFGGGVDLVDLGTDQYWQPTYFGSIGTDIGRSWSVHGNYSLQTLMLYSPLSAPDAYATHTLTFGVGGDLARSLGLGVHFGASRGEVQANQSITGSAGHYYGVNGGAQLSVRLSAGWSAVMSGNYYSSLLDGAAAQSVRASGDYTRTTLLGGFRWNVPLLDPRRTGRRAPG
jgi:hypothetical protein